MTVRSAGPGLVAVCLVALGVAAWSASPFTLNPTGMPGSGTAPSVVVPGPVPGSGAVPYPTPGSPFPAPAPAAVGPAQIAAHVVACMPAPFATNVDVKLAQISITFDKPMKTGGTSGFADIRWLGLYPGEGRPMLNWTPDGKTCHLPVKLEPNVTYAVTINAVGAEQFLAVPAPAPPPAVASRPGGPPGSVPAPAPPAPSPALPFTWVFSTGTRTPDEFPAYVVSSDPAQMATDVDAKRREISVTFSRPVAAGDFSWVTLPTCGQYPGLRGRLDAPKLSADHLTATLSAVLSPNTVYALSINDVSFPGYKDLLGHPLVPYAWSFKTSGAGSALPTAVVPPPTAGATPGPAAGATTAPEAAPATAPATTPALPAATVSAPAATVPAAAAMQVPAPGPGPVPTPAPAPTPVAPAPVPAPVAPVPAPTA